MCISIVQHKLTYKQTSQQFFVCVEMCEYVFSSGRVSITVVVIISGLFRKVHRWILISVFVCALFIILEVRHSFLLWLLPVIVYCCALAIVVVIRMKYSSVNGIVCQTITKSTHTHTEAYTLADTFSVIHHKNDEPQYLCDHIPCNFNWIHRKGLILLVSHFINVNEHISLTIRKIDV